METKIKKGDKLKVVTSFEDLRETWGFSYPKTGEILTVKSYNHNEGEGVNTWVYFEELNLGFGLALYGNAEPNFELVK